MMIIIIIIMNKHWPRVMDSLPDVLDDGLHHVLPAVRLHRVDVLHDLRGERQTAADHLSSHRAGDGNRLAKQFTFSKNNVIK